MIDAIYDDSPTNKIIHISFNGHAADLPDLGTHGTISSRLMLKTGFPKSAIHIGQAVLVTDVADLNPPGSLHIRGIALPPPGP